jgi:Stress responsive A/B Barrel Domain
VEFVEDPAPRLGRIDSCINPGLTPGANFRRSLRDIAQRRLIPKAKLSRLVLWGVAVLALAALLSGCMTASKSAKAGKFYHVGLVWLREPGNAEHRQKIVAAAHSFAREIPEVQFLSVGQTLPKTSSYADASFDVCFVMRLEDKAALDRYGKHPVHHGAAREVFLPLSQRIVFYDFTSE